MSQADGDVAVAARRRRQVLDRFCEKIDKCLPESGELRPWKLAEIELALLDGMNELARDIMESRIGVDPERCPEKPRCRDCGRALGGVDRRTSPRQVRDLGRYPLAHL